MASISLTAPVAMATTQLARAIHIRDACTAEPEIKVERTPLRMSWVVATDGNGNRMLRMRWEPSA